jgi:hypothetical protein
MLDYRLLAKRFATAIGLATAVVGAAALGGPAARADTPPTRAVPAVVGTVTAQVAPISPLKVLAFGHEATISFTTAEPAAVTVTHKLATTRAAAGPAPATAPAGAFGTRPASVQQFGDVRPLQILRQYTTTHQVKLTGLTSNTAYTVTVVAETQSGQKHTVETELHTAKARIRVTLREINIEYDGDVDPGWGWAEVERAGDPLWVVGLAWGGVGVGGCFPVDCDYGEYQAGRIFPRNSAGQSLTWLFAEENFDKLPDRLKLYTYTVEDDGVFGAIGAAIVGCFNPGAFGCDFVVSVAGGYAYDSNHGSETSWTMPQGEFSSTTVMVRGDDKTTAFKSVLTFTFETFHDLLSYPAPQRNKPSSTWR